MSEWMIWWSIGAIAIGALNGLVIVLLVTGRRPWDK